MLNLHDAPWQEMPKQEQLNLFNAACGDLATQIEWYGFRLSKDDWRHFISGTVLGWRMLPGIDMGTGPAGFVMLGGSSMNLSKVQCTAAVQIAFAIGDDPQAYGQKHSPVRWCKSVCGARWIDVREAA